VKVLKVGGRSYQKYFKNSFMCYDGKNMGSKVVRVTPAKGWKVRGIVATASGKSRKIKSGGKSLKGTDTIQVYLVHKKTGMKETITLASFV